MKRLFYLVSAIDSVEEISEDLHEHGVTDWRFHILSKNEAGLYERHLHSASIFDRTDLVRFVERGAIIGGLFGLAFILPTVLLGFFELPTLAWVALFAFCVFAGGWIAGFGGITAENYRIRPYHDAVERGEYLVMVDVPKQYEDEMKRLMAKNHPEARLQGEDSSYNNPFVESDGKFHVV